jgi:hypothetical protein
LTAVLLSNSLNLLKDSFAHLQSNLTSNYRSMANNPTQPLLQHSSTEHTHYDTVKELASKGRKQVKRFQLSRFSLYLTLLLVGIDVCCIFADIFIELYQCEKENKNPSWDVARDVFGTISNVITCAMVAELLLSMWAFGLG